MNKKRYAFIDVDNTSNTTEQLLNFTIDWEKLYNHLMRRWRCEKVLFYAGIEVGDINKEQEYKTLEQVGYRIKSKTTIPYKIKDKQINIKCIHCGYNNLKTIRRGYRKKSNCDVELTTDIIRCAEPNVEFLIFTGDGDFEYLIKYVVFYKGASVYIVSNTSKSNITGKRFSSKLNKLLKYNNINFIDINTWKNIIRKAP